MKFKHIKFPSNFRIITDPTILFKIYRGALKVFIMVIFVLAIVIVGLDLQTNIQAKKTIDLEREELTKELKFWESFIAKHKDYADAFFEASVLEYRMGNTFGAKSLLEKGLSLDPNSKEGRKIEKILNK